MKPRYISLRQRVMTHEAYRILAAADERRLRCTHSGRYVIDGSATRPDRRTREALLKSGYLSGVTLLHLTDKGVFAIDHFTIRTAVDGGVAS